MAFIKQLLAEVLYFIEGFYSKVQNQVPVTEQNRMLYCVGTLRRPTH